VEKALADLFSEGPVQEVGLKLDASSMDLDLKETPQLRANSKGTDTKTEAEEESSSDSDESESSGSSGSDSDSSVEIVIGNTSATASATAPPKRKAETKDSATAVETSAESMNTTPLVHGFRQPVYNRLMFYMDLDNLSNDQKDWRKPGANSSSWFNYGFVEDTWREYVMKQATGLKNREVYEQAQRLLADQIPSYRPPSAVKQQLPPLITSPTFSSPYMQMPRLVPPEMQQPMATTRLPADDQTMLPPGFEASSSLSGTSATGAGATLPSESTDISGTTSHPQPSSLLLAVSSEKDRTSEKDRDRKRRRSSNRSPEREKRSSGRRHRSRSPSRDRDRRKDRKEKKEKERKREKEKKHKSRR